MASSESTVDGRGGRGRREGVSDRRPSPGCWQLAGGRLHDGPSAAAAVILAFPPSTVPARLVPLPLAVQPARPSLPPSLPREAPAAPSLIRSHPRGPGWGPDLAWPDLRPHVAVPPRPCRGGEKRQDGTAAVTVVGLNPEGVGWDPDCAQGGGRGSAGPTGRPSARSRNSSPSTSAPHTAPRIPHRRTLRSRAV